MRKNKFDWLRVKNDVNGNPRYVCHYLSLLTPEEQETCWKEAKEEQEKTGRFIMGIDRQYELALTKARKIGGKKFHTKQYGGGIVFQSYNLTETERSLGNR